MATLGAAEQTRARGGKPDASLRIAILLEEKHIAEAIALAADHGCNLRLLETLAAQAETIDPAAAAAFYRRVVEFSLSSNPGNATYAAAVSHLRRMHPLMAAAAFDSYVADLRQRFRAKRNFIKALDGMGV
jgi:hypothetical protein